MRTAAPDASSAVAYAGKQLSSDVDPVTDDGVADGVAVAVGVGVAVATALSVAVDAYRQLVRL